MLLGIRAHDFGLHSLEALASQVAGHGFGAVQFAAPKSIAGLADDLRQLTPELAASVRETFQRAGVLIAVLGCYINLVNPDESRRQRDLARFKLYLRLAREFGCELVGTETGSLHTDFSFHPDNHGEAAFQTVLASVRELTEEAERCGASVAIEGVASLVISSAARLRRLIDETASSQLRVIFDPVNLLTVENHHAQRAIMDEAFALLGARISAVHVKDFVVRDGKLQSVPAGEGQLDLAHLLRWVKTRQPGIPVLLEETRPETVARSAAYVRQVYAGA